MNTIRLAIFDLGGTIVDKYSLSPFLSLKHAFKMKGLQIPNSLIFKDMGKHKYDHINDILLDKDIYNKWKLAYDREPDHTDCDDIFNIFNIYQLNEGIQKIEILPETKKCIDWLGDNNISTGVTTGFNKPIMSLISDKLYENDIFIDKYVSSTCLGKPGRPNPHMIREIMSILSIEDPIKVIKIDDTGVGIQEGKNAGCITVGVAKYSTLMKMKDYDERLSREEYIERLKNSREILWSSNPDYVIDTLDELPNIIKHINSESNI
jgi:phosphonoacetaldehyde hydrolase